jgi:hypothetical protein
MAGGSSERCLAWPMLDGLGHEKLTTQRGLKGSLPKWKLVRGSRLGEVLMTTSSRSSTVWRCLSQALLAVWPARMGATFYPGSSVEFDGAWDSSRWHNDDLGALAGVS